MSTFEALSFYRGVSAKYPTDKPTLLKPRRDRRPKNSSAFFHDVADRWFESRFGIAYRSTGLFLTSRPMSASTYAGTPAHVMRIVPLSAYRYCWSPKVSDLLFAASRLGASPAEAIEAYLDSVQYCEIGLQEAHDAGHEVMLYCEQYVAIPLGLLEATLRSKAQSIILPG
jgi:hypothetical protein